MFYLSAASVVCWIIFFENEDVPEFIAYTVLAVLMLILLFISYLTVQNA